MFFTPLYFPLSSDAPITQCHEHDDEEKKAAECDSSTLTETEGQPVECQKKSQHSETLGLSGEFKSHVVKGILCDFFLSSQINIALDNKPIPKNDNKHRL